MSMWLMALHLLNFLAPAFGLALMLGVLGLFFDRKRPSPQYLYISAAMYFVASMAVLLLGLALLGRDGKTITYAALVSVNAALAAWRHR
jgi:hypothetical membrane protein